MYGFCISEMIYTMKKVHALWVSICLMLNLAPAPLNADSEEDEEYTIITGKILEAFIFLS